MVRNSISNHVKNNIIYDERFLPEKFEIGESAPFEMPSQLDRRKLASVVKGPYTVLKKVPQVN